MKYGLILKPIEEGELVFGFGGVPSEILQENGDWTDFLPVKELQNLNNVEPYACVIFTILNCVENLIFKKYGLKRNYSDRFLAAMVGTKGKGCDPHTACEFLREIGVPPQEIWPFDETINTEEKFFEKPNPKIHRIAREFLDEFEFKHDHVPNSLVSMKQALKTSPLLISVSAWHQDEKGMYYDPEGMPNNHATTLFHITDGYKEVFDTYDNYIKKLKLEDKPSVVKRFYIRKKDTAPQSYSLRKEIINFFKEILHL